jgi:transposase
MARSMAKASASTSKQVLIPTLHSGDIVIMDNLGLHGSSAFLPKYSPDLSPIEMLFSKLKHGLRKAAKCTHDAVYQTNVELLPIVHPIECANYFAKAGYART